MEKSEWQMRTDAALRRRSLFRPLISSTPQPTMSTSLTRAPPLTNVFDGPTVAAPLRCGDGDDGTAAPGTLHCW